MMEQLHFPIDLLGLGFGLVWGCFGFVWPQAHVMESLCFPIDLLGSGLVTVVAMRAMIAAPSARHARTRLATTELLHELAVRKNPSQADQPEKSCLLTP